MATSNTSSWGGLWDSSTGTSGNIVITTTTGTWSNTAITLDSNSINVFSDGANIWTLGSDAPSTYYVPKPLKQGWLFDYDMLPEHTKIDAYAKWREETTYQTKRRLAH